jgi:hypothetical protein
VRLWIDDERPIRPDWNDGATLTVKNSKAALEALILFEDLITDISFDHDLGGDDTTRPIVLWMAEMERWPRRCYVHTANLVGREWLEGMITRYGPGVSQ